MSNVIQFLESMGRNPAMSAAQYAAAVDALNVSDSQKLALSQRDHAQLNVLLGGSVKPMMLSQYAPEGESSEEGDSEGHWV